MKEEYIKFMEQVLAMIAADQAFSSATLRHDYQSDQRYLQQSKEARREVWDHVTRRLDEIKNGEQPELFT